MWGGMALSFAFCASAALYFWGVALDGVDAVHMCDWVILDAKENGVECVVMITSLSKSWDADIVTLYEFMRGDIASLLGR